MITNVVVNRKEDIPKVTNMTKHVSNGGMKVSTSVKAGKQAIYF